MDSRLTSEQLEMRRALREVLTDACPPSVVRAQWNPDAPSVVTTKLWQRLRELGLFGVLASQEIGGMGGNEVDLAVLLAECGRFAVPGPLIETMAVGVPAAAELPGETVADVLSGALVVTAAPAGAGWFAEADTAALFVQVSGGELAMAEAEDVRVGARRETIDRSVRHFEVTGGAWRAIAGSDGERAGNRATLAVAAQLIGLADRMISMTVDYVQVRAQFGKAIGTQQAVKHHLATALIALEHARPVVYRAAYSVAFAEPNARRDVSFAKVYAHRSAALAARVALQCHGAIGYSWEHDLNLWMKRVWALAPAWGTVAAHEAVVAAAVLDGAPS
ncbi:acyl-CoA dehydrogenase family protein [Jatrophihabitans sp.]|uniref:acyl-CoA dehydrogenase family protein n=1 Tax=Jatrophihabitans sp. TaxID=1932789 RepID=UPI0030C757FF|nr:acyl-CoA dehydrogenase [Jatrophihabitans sp.]